MASEAQVQANRLNARRSTGPRTGAGKAVVAQNAVRHGLLAQQTVIGGEDPGEFEFYRDQMLGELSPAGALESMLAERVVGLAWRLRRADRIQAEVFDALLVEDATDPVKKLVRSMRAKRAGAGPGETALGRVVVRDFGGARVLDRLGLYERRIEHSLYKTLNELQKLRLLRELEPSPEERAPEAASRKAGTGTTRCAERTSPRFRASRTEDDESRQTKPISAFSVLKTGFEPENKANQSQFSGPAERRWTTGIGWGITAGARGLGRGQKDRSRQRECLR